MATQNIKVANVTPQLDDTDKLAISIHAKSTNPGDTAVLVDANGHLQVDVLSGGGASSQFAEDTAHVTGDLGNFLLAVRADAATSTAGSDGDYSAIINDANGRLHVSMSDVQKDDTDKLAISLYGKNAAAGDTPVLVDGDGHSQVDVLTIPLPTDAATETKQDTGNTALAAIQTAVETVSGAVSGTEMQVDIVAALPAGTNIIGGVDCYPVKGVIAAVIAISETESGEISIGDYHRIALDMPAAWTAADISFKSSYTTGGTFKPVYDDSGLLVSAIVDAGRIVGLDACSAALEGLRYIKLVASVAQEAERTIQVIRKS